jgi:AraC-like DNA-binding protein
MIPVHKTLAYKGQVVFEKLAIPLPTRQVKPFHGKEACFIFVNEGDFSARTPDQFIPLKKGQGLLAKCFDFFFETTKKQRATGANFEAIGVLLFPAIVEDLFQFDLKQFNHRVDYNLKQVQIDRLLTNYMESIDLYLENPELADDAIIKSKLIEFVMLISKTQDAPHLDFLASLFELNHTEFRATISNNLTSNLSIIEFAQLCGMSVSSFKRKFASTFNESPKKYLAKMKLERASQLITNRDKRISEIAYDCGFENISTFNRSFKAQYGQSPSEYLVSHSA